MGLYNIVGTVVKTALKHQATLGCMASVRKEGVCPDLNGIFGTPPRELSTPPVENESYPTVGIRETG